MAGGDMRWGATSAKRHFGQPDIAFPPVTDRLAVA